MIEEKKENIRKEKESREIWLSVSESAKMAGVESKTIRRAIKNRKIKYKVNGNRYAIKMVSLINFAKSSPKLRNKFYSCGIGQYTENLKL
ncbi:hypothetical protein CVU82_03020 [Candidatus Falkowbacteria bacterium HGW-Falkowbacteria-1]|jgi:hypothetical protein|uniref:Helix-turn-helix domain-containing protein n=1 Tax=Candidatus Falkowbacteria bacterium HGW-Falkowbacteria-1 TaxID=2013768 RepID=A0A2N2EA06_9BACT|nr:MAG: hypothetical protein CVU82_03020 [Candidatus Falkowbacteria bacterium HGW-Falkowbacteria-1]